MRNSSQNETFESPFLMRLAPVYLACLWRAMGHGLIGKCWPKQDLANDLLGMHDYSWEMDLRAKRELARLKDSG